MKLAVRDKIKLVQRLDARLEGKRVPEIISLSYEAFGDGLAMTTAFGYSGIVLMSFVRDIIPELPIYFIDTRLHFEETIKLAEKIKSEWGLNIIHISTQFTEEELEKSIGKDTYKDNPDLCCHYRKVEPLLRVLRTQTAWLSAIRKDQSRVRAGIKVIEIDGRGIIKINPLYNWTKEQTWTYVRKNGLPYNPLYDQHYPSIGCKPCTSPVDQGGDERDGRWRGFQKMECGIHLNNNEPVISPDWMCNS
jgi:phosphoadenosine phosphosulfate reductase